MPILPCDQVREGARKLFGPRSAARVSAFLVLLSLLFSCAGQKNSPFQASQITVQSRSLPNSGQESTLPPSIPEDTNSSDPAAELFLDQLAERTWAYISSDWATNNHLPWSWRSAQSTAGDYANSAEMGFYLLSWIAAYDLRRPWSPTWAEASAEAGAVLDQLRAWQTGTQTSQPYGPNAYQNSVFYQWYWISEMPPVVGANTGLNQLVPSIDNAWLAASLVTVRAYAEANGHPSLAVKANAILTDMDFSLWYHADSHRFSWGAVRDPAGGARRCRYRLT